MNNFEKKKQLCFIVEIFSWNLVPPLFFIQHYSSDCFFDTFSITFSIISGNIIIILFFIIYNNFFHSITWRSSSNRQAFFQPILDRHNKPTSIDIDFYRLFNFVWIQTWSKLSHFGHAMAIQGSRMDFQFLKYGNFIY